MSRWTGSWLPGSPEQGAGDLRPQSREYPGERLGLPAAGPDSVAGLGRRCAAFVIDIMLSALVAGLFTAPALPGNWSLLPWAVFTVLPTAIFGMTPGMTVLGLRVARLGDAVYVGIPRAALRTVLLFFVVPAVVMNADRRGLHDQAAGTVVLRSR